MTALLVDRLLEESIAVKAQLKQTQGDKIAQAGQLITSALRSGHKILFFGNGGSAADAQHLAAEFVGRFVRERQPLPAIALTTDTSALTAIGNDYGFEQVFARQLQALGMPGDVAVAISTSGRSANVIAATEVARRRSVMTIGLCGGDGGQLAALVDIPIIVPSRTTARIQECHIAIGHIWCEMVDAQLTTEAVSSRQGQSQSALDGAKITDLSTLCHLREQWHQDGKTVVWTNGCFDLLHIGHVRSLQESRSLGDILVVGLNSDHSVRRIKGPERPIVPESARAELLAALTCVDYVVVFDEDTPEGVLAQLRPDIHCKGADYAPPQGKPIPEAAVVRAYGGRIEFISLVPGVSTTDLVHRVQERSHI